MSVGVFPLQSAEASKVVAELEKVFGDSSKTPVAGMFRFMPLEGAERGDGDHAAGRVPAPRSRNGIDAHGRAAAKVAACTSYEVKYVKATDLADQLGDVYGNAAAARTSAAARRR